MKWMIASDIHGSASDCQQTLALFEKENAEKLLLLGDLLYHGPRNGLPEDYNPKEVASLLNAYKDKIICVRGNCDADVDQLLLEFPIKENHRCYMLSGRPLFVTHGHVYNESNPPAFRKNGILLCGHFHVPAITRHEHFLYLNPGSVTFPKSGFPKTYMILEDGKFTIKDFSGNIFLTE